MNYFVFLFPPLLCALNVRPNSRGSGDYPEVLLITSQLVRPVLAGNPHRWLFLASLLAG